MHLMIGIEDYRYDFLLEEPKVDLEIVAVTANEPRTNHLRFVNILMVVVVLNQCQGLFDTRPGNQSGSNPVMEQTVSYIDWRSACPELRHNSAFLDLPSSLRTEVSPKKRAVRT